LKPATRVLLIVIVLLLFVPIACLQEIIDPQRHTFEPKNLHTDKLSALPVEFMLGAAVGFREAIAGLLWVRTDQFFHQGDYEAIIPMVRIITWLDPHNVDVYLTGAWHLDYNFTDSDQRSDRRFIPYSLALLREGIENNPGVSDFYSDIAFTHYFRKLQDFPMAIYWFEQGAKNCPNWDYTRIGHGLAHAYEATGQVDQAIAEWQQLVQLHEAAYKRDPHDTPDRSGMQVAEKNLHENILRKKWRLIDTQPPVNVHFSAQLERIAPMVLLVKGTMNVIGSKNFILETHAHTWAPIDGCRVEIRLQDADYKMPANVQFNMSNNLPQDVTIMQDSISVRGGTFDRKYDLSKDSPSVAGDKAIYNFAAKKYTVTLWFNPGTPADTPPDAQDRIGWIGEGMTDDNYLDKSGILPFTAGSKVNGLRMIKKTFYLTQDDILGSGVKTFN